jgi:hypothetical protein
MNFLIDWFKNIKNIPRALLGPFLLVNRRKKRLPTLGFGHRKELPIAEIDPGLGSTCASPLCIRCSLNYDAFFQINISPYKRRSSQKSTAVTLMALDLKKYNDFTNYCKALRKYSYFLRNSKKAIHKGYRFEQFQYLNHTPDMRAIRSSLSERARGLPIDPFVLTEHALNTDPLAETPVELPQCPQHWEMWFGIFQDAPGHTQGTLQLNKKLIAYARLRRIGNTIKYAEFIGHGDQLKDNVMTLLHIQLMEWLMHKENIHTHGIDYVTYNTVEKGDEGLLFWKRKALFTPFAISMKALSLPEDFDPQTYLSLNPDLKKSENEAAIHYLRHGRTENRIYKLELPEDFDPVAYLELNHDLTKLNVEPKLHFILHGRAEGRDYKFRN